MTGATLQNHPPCTGVQRISLMLFTAPPVAAPPRPYPPPPHSTVRSSHPICRPPLQSPPPLRSQFSATGPDPLLHRCLPPRFTHTLPIRQPTVRTQRHQSIDLRCADRLLISSAVPLRRCGLQSPDAVLLALLSITLSSQTPPLQDPRPSPSFPVHLSTITPLTSLGPSLPLLLASL